MAERPARILVARILAGHQAIDESFRAGHGLSRGAFESFARACRMASEGLGQGELASVARALEAVTEATLRSLDSPDRFARMRRAAYGGATGTLLVQLASLAGEVLTMPGEPVERPTGPQN